MDHFSCVVLQCSSCLSFSRPNVGIVCRDEGHPCLSAFYELTLPELKYNPNPGPSLHLIPTKVPSISSSGQLNDKSGVNRRQLCQWLCPLFHPSSIALVCNKTTTRKEEHQRIVKCVKCEYPPKMARLNKIYDPTACGLNVVVFMLKHKNSGLLSPSYLSHYHYW